MFSLGMMHCLFRNNKDGKEASFSNKKYVRYWKYFMLKMFTLGKKVMML